MLVAYPHGNYSYLRGIAPYSAGVRADEGFDIVHVRLHRPVPLEAGASFVEQHLAAAGRPIFALCGIELRSPRPFTFEGFVAFNAEYVEILRKWAILIGEENPVARTNIAPDMGAPTQPSIYGFSYTMPNATGSSTSFVVAGGGELPEGSLDPADVIRRGDTSIEGLRDKVRFVMKLMSGRLRGLGVDWNSVSTANMYTIHPVCSILATEIMEPMHGAEIHGITWHYARPPIVTIEFEMDVRGVGQEIVARL